jgi:hypothetical protein
MLFAKIMVCLMITGIAVRERNMLMASGTGYGTIARSEAERAAGFGTLLMILTTPWLVIAGLWLHFAG